MNLNNSRPFSSLTAFRPASQPRFGVASSAVAGEQLRVWWFRAVSFCCIGYIIASQGLVYYSGWSRFGFVLAALLMMLLIAGKCLKTFSLKSVGWVGIALVFVAFCGLRSLPEPGQGWPLDTLFKLSSVFLGGIGVGLALQAGVPFKGVVWAQTIIFLGNVVASLCGIGLEPPAEVEAGRQAGLTGNANELAMQLTLGACLVWLSPKKSGALVSLLGIAAVGYAFLTTGSRKSVVVLVFFMMIVLIHLVATFKAYRSRVALILGGSFLVLGVIVGPTMLERTKDVPTVRRTLDYRDSSFDKRLEMTQQAIRLWKAAPLAGWGTDAFARVSGFGMYAHNNLAELLCDLGLVGIFLFYSLYGYILLKAKRLPAPLNICLVVFVVLLLVVDTGLVTYIRKQSVMIVMILASIAATPEILLGGRTLAGRAAGARED